MDVYIYAIHAENINKDIMYEVLKVSDDSVVKVFTHENDLNAWLKANPTYKVVK